MAKAVQTKNKPAQRTAQRPAQKPAQQQSRQVAATQPSRQQVAKPQAGGALQIMEDLELDDLQRRRLQLDAGRGTSTKMEDNVTPLIYVLQAQSPQCLKGHEKYLEGAEAGCIWLRNNEAGENLYEGSDGIYFQPCHYKSMVVEWAPDRGGLVNRYEEMPEGAEQVDEEDDNGNIRKVWKLGENTLVSTRYFTGFAIVDDKVWPYTIPMSGSNVGTAKQWMTALNNTSKDGIKLPLWASVWRLSSKLRSKDNFNWYQFEVERVGYLPPNSAQYAAGRVLHESMEAGDRKIGEEVDTAAEPGTAGTDNVGDTF